MSPVCSHQTMAATSKRSLRRSPNAGIWDTGECLTLVISESPQNAAEYSWSPVWESIPPSACWLTPDQWSAFQARRRWAAPGADAHPTLLAGFPDGTSIDISGGNIVAVADARHQMVERARTIKDDGLRKGLDATNFTEAGAAGNAVCPPVARWLEQKLRGTFA